MIKFTLKYLTYISIGVLAVATPAYLVDMLTVVNEETLIGTFSVMNYSAELNPELYSTIQFLAELPFFYIIIAIFNLLNLYLKSSKDQARSSRDQDTFNALQSDKAQMELLYFQHKVKNDLDLSDSQAAHFKIKANELINKYDAYNIEKLDATNLSLDEQLLINNSKLALYDQIKLLLEKTNPGSLELSNILEKIALVTTEIAKISLLLSPSIKV